MTGNAPIIAEMAATLEQLITRVDELEAERAASALSGEVLLLPGVKRLLMSRFNPDQPRLNEAEQFQAERTALTQAMRMIIAAYDALEKKGGQSWLTTH